MALSPMMSKYLETKKEYPDCILFYRLGDFYEMFFEDATEVARELELTLTGKDCGLEERAPMCGVPYHAAETYINRLVQNGHKVAIAEQMEDPKLAKGLVKREVVRIVTPGTITSTGVLADDKNNYIISIFYIDERFGLAICDISTGDFFVTELVSIRELFDEIQKYQPTEIICNHAFEISGISLEELKKKYNITITSLDNTYFSEKNSIDILKRHFAVSSIEALGLSEFLDATISSGAMLRYLYEMQKSSCAQIVGISAYKNGDYMIVDTSSRRNLELVETMREKKKNGSLLGVLDKTNTAMGARMLRGFLEQPLVNKERIINRQEAVAELFDRYIDREELREYLNPIYDLERLMSRVVTKNANTRDLLSLSASMKMISPIKEVLKTFESEEIKKTNNNLDRLEDIIDIIDRAINEDSPLSLKEGNIINTGYNSEIDKLRQAKTEGKNWLASLESEEKEKTGIKNLKVKFNKVFGYYFEVTNSFKDMVPDYFIRKQTLTNAERYTTDKLKDLENIILGAEDKLNSLEYEVFVEIRDEIANNVNRIQSSAKAIAYIDAICSLATVAYNNNYVKPEINTTGIIDIKDGRHPVVETMLSDDSFIANDTYLDQNKKRMSIITGPNMAGKSTYMRQTALICMMAQIGSFVPAKQANLCVCDRIFTRVGASDDLASGQSTFMVEMTEVANILRNATRNSLVILDEIGRGTSTFDGLAIAWAVVEHISNIKLIGAKTLFATHYHELSELEGTLPGVNNYCISVKENGDNIVFLRKIITGGADKSYGIQVAKLAGVPDSVTNRAKELIEELSSADIATRAREIAEATPAVSKRKPVKKMSEVEAGQLSLFDAINNDTIIKEISEIDITSMTPMDALNTLYALQNKIKNRI